jgi:hypothetical protein
MMATLRQKSEDEAKLREEVKRSHYSVYKHRNVKFVQNNPLIKNSLE